jgi:hypothetical protein
MVPQVDRLASVLADAARGTFPAPDGGFEALPAPHGPAMAVLGFSGHHLIASSAPGSWVRDQLAGRDPGAPMSPPFITRLGELLGREDDGLDVLLAAPGLSGAPALVQTDRDDHPRVTRATRHREDVRVFEDAAGDAVVVLGRGLARRVEVAVEVTAGRHGAGLGHRMLTEARRLVSPEEFVFAQTAPGNAAALRALLGAGFHPVGAEVLFF